MLIVTGVCIALSRIPLKVILRGLKPLWIRMAELLLFFFIAGAISLGIEASLGQIYPQSWQFYVVGLSLFLVFAFPGFVIRYMLLKRG